MARDGTVYVPPTQATEYENHNTTYATYINLQTLGAAVNMASYTAGRPLLFQFLLILRIYKSTLTMPVLQN